MGLGGGEVEQGRAIGRRFHRAEVHLEPPGELDRGAGGSLRHDVRHVRVGHEAADHPGRIPARHQDVEIAHRFLAAAIAARDGDLVDAAARLDIIEQRRGVGFGVVEQQAPFAVRRPAQAGADLVHHLRAEPFELAHPSRRECSGEVGGRFHLQLRMQQLDPLRPEAGNPQKIEQAGRHLSSELLVQRQRPRRDDGADLPGEVLADAGELGEVARPHTDRVGERLGEVPDRARGGAIGPHAKRVGVLNLEEVRDFVEQPRNVRILHTRPAPRAAPSLPGPTPSA